jgi:hypothetical protein
MRAHASILSLVGPLLGMLVSALPLQSASNLLDNSPFLPVGLAAGSAQEAAPLELRSVLKEGNDYEFSLFDTAKRLSTWVRLNEAGHDFTVKAYDPDKETATVEQKNRTYKLALKESKIALLAGGAPGQPPMMVGMPPNGAPGALPLGYSAQTGPYPVGGRGPAGTAPSLTPEQLRNLEADINRRRELRRQAAAAQSGAAAAQSTGQPQQR